ncbi:MAG: PAS domain S-box protein [Syntrophorhabdales bacterium]
MSTSRSPSRESGKHDNGGPEDRRPEAGPEAGKKGAAKKITVEKALRESERKFRDLSEKSLVGIYLIQHGLFRYVNPRFAEIFAYDVEEVVDRKAPRDLVLPEDQDMVEESIRRRVSGRIKSARYEFRGITKDRRTVNVEVYASRTEYGGESAVIGTLQDITERKLAEGLLRRAEERYRGIFENAVEGIFQSTPAGQFLVVNPVLARMMGYETPDEFVAAVTDMTHQLYTEPERRAEFMDALKRDDIIRGFECQWYRKDGSKIWVSINARVTRDPYGPDAHYEGSIEDITERIKAEYELRLANELNKTIVDHAPVAIFTLDRDGLFTSVNPALGALTGLGIKAEEKLIGFNWLKNPFTVRSGLAKHIKRGLRGEPFQLWDSPFVNWKGDKKLYIDFKGVPLKGKDGSVEGLLCIIEETTTRVKTRAKLMQEAKMSFIGKLAAGIAHQLNNPLAMIVAYAELAKKYFGQEATGPAQRDKLAGYLDIVAEEAFRCKIVMDDLLSLPQKEGFEVTDVDVNGLINGLLELINVGKSNIRIVREFDPLLPLTRADVAGLRQVFLNLLTNALDAVEGRLDGTIVIRTRAERENILVEVEDNGIGIPGSIADKIFEPFFTTKERKKGIGIGLSLCRELLSNMGGTVRLEERPGCGTIFLVMLPPSGKEGNER